MPRKNLPFVRLLPLRAFVVTSLALATTTYARPVAIESLSSLAQKAEILVVAEVTRIDNGPIAPSDTWKIPLLQKHATLKILRGLHPADSTAVEFEQLTLQYPALPPGIDLPPNGPAFPTLAVGQVLLLPLKHLTADTWQFINEENYAMVMPAAARTMSLDAPDARIFLFRELAGAFTYGDFDTMARAGRYLDSLGTDKESAVEPVFAIIKNEIGDSSLKEDARWVQIAVAAYTASNVAQRPTLAELLNGPFPQAKGLHLAALSLRKTGHFQLDQRIIQLLLNHQDDPGAAPAIAATLAQNYPDDPYFLTIERQSLADGKPAALLFANTLITSRAHPLAATASAAALTALANALPKPPSKDIDTSPDTLPTAPTGTPPAPKPALLPTPITPTLRAAVSLLLRAGTDDDLTALLDLITRSRTLDPALYENFLILAGSRPDFPTNRVLNICRLYIEDPTPMLSAPAAHPFRLNDLAALTVTAYTKQNFGFNATDPEPIRNPAITQTATWLKTH